MAVSRKIERELLREDYLKQIIENFLDKDEQVLRVKSNEIAIPVVGCEGNEDFIVVTVKVPTGANKGLEPYDGFELAEDYEMKLAEKERKAKENAEKKAKKSNRLGNMKPPNGKASTRASLLKTKQRAGSTNLRLPIMRQSTRRKARMAANTPKKLSRKISGTKINILANILDLAKLKKLRQKMLERLMTVLLKTLLIQLIRLEQIPRLA